MDRFNNLFYLDYIVSFFALRPLQDSLFLPFLFFFNSCGTIFRLLKA